MVGPPPLSTLFPYTSLFRSRLSRSVAVLLFGLVSLAAVTVTVLTSWADRESIPVDFTERWTPSAVSSLTMVSLMAPETFVWPLPLQTNAVRPAGTGSLTATLVGVLGPVVLTVMV